MKFIFGNKHEQIKKYFYKLINKNLKKDNSKIL